MFSNISVSRDFSEVTQILLNTLLLLLLSVSQCILSNLKDSVILVYHPDGVFAIAAIMVWGLLPGAVVTSWLFAKLVRLMGHLHASYVTLGAFLVYFLLFAFVLFPHRDACELPSVGRWLEWVLPGFGKGIASCVRYWVVSGFYVMCDVWASAVVAVIFWGLINTRTPPERAQRQYGFLKIGATVSALIAGITAGWFVQAEYNPDLLIGATAWEQTLAMQTLFIVGMGLVSLWLLRLVSSEPGREKPKKRDSLSLREALRTLSQDRYLVGIAVTVVGYAVVFIMSDLMWKHHLRIVYVDPNAMMMHLNYVMGAIGVVSVIAALLSPWLLRRYGWMFVANMTPYAVSVTGIALFAAVFWGSEFAEWFPERWGVSSVWMVVYVGSLHMCFLKAFKFSVFDISKELAFTPLAPSVQWRGKLAIDGVGYYAGKMGTSLVQQVVIVALGGVMASAAFMGGVVLLTLLGWIASVHRIGVGYAALTGEVAPENPQPERVATR